MYIYTTHIFDLCGMAFVLNVFICFLCTSDPWYFCWKMPVYHNPTSEQGVPSHCGPEVGLSGRRGQVGKPEDHRLKSAGLCRRYVSSLVNTCGLLVGDL